MTQAGRAADRPEWFWSALKWVILGPLLRLLWRPRAEGLEHIPAAGGAVLAANHVSFLDPLLLPLVVPRRQVRFLAKTKYIDKAYLGWFLRGVGVIPVAPDGRGGDAVGAGIQAARAGHLVGIFPEGTRSAGGPIGRGRTGVARIALEAGVPVIPAGITGTDRAFPRGARLPRPAPVRIRFGPPMMLTPADGPAADPAAARRGTDQVMAAIAALCAGPAVPAPARKRGRSTP